MVDDLKAKGIILHNHICGNTIPIINDFIATGAQVLEIDHKTDKQKAKDAGRGKTCFLGPINTSLLATGSPQEVEAACQEAIAIMAPGSGFILGPGCALRRRKRRVRTSTPWSKRRKSTGVMNEVRRMIFRRTRTTIAKGKAQF